MTVPAGLSVRGSLVLRTWPGLAAALGFTAEAKLITLPQPWRSLMPIPAMARSPFFHLDPDFNAPPPGYIVGVGRQSVMPMIALSAAMVIPSSPSSFRTRGWTRNTSMQSSHRATTVCRPECAHPSRVTDPDYAAAAFRCRRPFPGALLAPVAPCRDPHWWGQQTLPVRCGDGRKDRSSRFGPSE